MTHAAEGSLQFSDPSTAAGETVEVKAKVEAGGAVLGDIEITVAYDTTLLKFLTGTNVTGENGTLKLSKTGDGTATEAEFIMQFTALNEGKAVLTATENKAYLSSDEVVNLTLGASEVTIQGGTPVTDTEAPAGEQKSSGNVQVIVDGGTYTVNENFSEAVIPKGFEAADAEIDGKATKAMIQQSSGQYLFYLEDSAGESNYYLYSTEDGSFATTEVVAVNGELTLLLMNHTDKEGLPEEYKETTTTIGGKEFSAWNNVSEPDYYLIYALNSEGESGYYQYDSKEGTYQRYTVAGVTKEKAGNSLMDKALNFAKDYMIPIMCVIWGVFLLLLIIVIVLAVKLGHRNQELDDLYDEYDIDDNAPTNQPKSKKKAKSIASGKQQYDYEEEYGDDDFEDDEYDDDFDDEDDGYDEEYSDDDFEDDEYDDEFDEYDDDFEDDDEFEDEEPAPGRGNKRKGKGDYSVDFIDI